MIKLVKSTFYQEAKTKIALINFIRGAWQLSFGLESKKFEDNFSHYQARKYGIFLNSGSSANLAIIQALLNLGKIKKGDMVGFSALTWSTNVMPLIELGLKVLPIDVELDTLNVSSKKLLDCLKKYPIKMLFLTNLLGFCGDIDKIAKICRQKKIILVEDNCESLGTIYQGRKLGNFGLASTFSFFVGHHLSTIEGGMVCTDDRELATMLKIVRAHGWDRNLEKAEQEKLKNKFKIESSFYDHYAFYDLGFNLRPTEIQGFLGNQQLQYVQEIIRKRNHNFLQLAKVIYKKIDKYYPINFSHIDFVSNFAFPVICRSKKIRNALIEKCGGRIEIRPIVGGDMTQQPFFRKYSQKFGHLSDKSNVSIIHQQGLYFGNNPELTKKEIKTIIDIFAS